MALHGRSQTHTKRYRGLVFLRTDDACAQAYLSLLKIRFMGAGQEATSGRPLMLPPILSTEWGAAARALEFICNGLGRRGRCYGNPS